MMNSASRDNLAAMLARGPGPRSRPNSQPPGPANVEPQTLPPMPHGEPELPPIPESEPPPPAPISAGPSGEIGADNEEVYDPPREMTVVKDYKSKDKDDLQLKKGVTVLVSLRKDGRFQGVIKGKKGKGWCPEDVLAATEETATRKDLKKKTSSLGKKDGDKVAKDLSKRGGSNKKSESMAAMPTTSGGAPVAAAPATVPLPASTGQAVAGEYGSRRQRAGTLEAALTLRPNAQRLLQAGILKPTKNVPVFGVPLGQLMYISYTEFEIPDVFQDCDRALRASDNLKQEGIFRISGQMDELQAIKKAYDTGNSIELAGYSPHSVAGALKLFFRELPEPLMTFRAYPAWLKSIHTPPESRAQETQALLKSMPPHATALLRVLVALLVETAQHHKVNLMSPSNLGIVFGPTLLRPEVEDASMFLDSSKQANVVEFLISHHSEVFVD